MKTAVLIIAHNEEKYIGKCIESILEQTQKADEIVLIVHNSTDRTKEIADGYPIMVIPYTGPVGITYARIEGLKHVSGEIILCIDGDSHARSNWIRDMTAALAQRNNVLVGSWVKWQGNLLYEFNSILNKYFCVHTKPAYWIWGLSMAFWGKDKEVVRDIFEKSYLLSAELGLSRNPDDFWLALFMEKRGNLEVINTTHVIGNMKEQNSWAGFKRNRENNKNARLMKKYFKSSIENL